MKNKKVLLVGTSFSAVPLLLSLKEQGYYIAVCGGLKEDPCHSFADQSYYIDYSKKELLLKLCEENDFDFLIPSCNDFSYNSCSYVSTKLNKFYGFDNYEKTMLLHTKNAFRKFTLQNNLSVPRAIKYNENLDFDNLELNYPILVKPDYSFSGKGISKVYDISELKASINHAKDNSKNGELILEEFVKGELFSHSAFIQNGEISIDFFVSEFCTVYPYQVDYSYLSNDLDEEVRLKVRKEISYIVKELNLVDGLLHTQFISDKKNFWLIETMRRCPGDLYGTLINKTTGFQYSKTYVNFFLNKYNNIDNFEKMSIPVFRHTISSDQKIIYLSLDVNINELSEQLYPLKNSGEILNMAPYDKLGIIFIHVNSENKFNEYKLRLKELIKIKGIKID